MPTIAMSKTAPTMRVADRLRRGVNALREAPLLAVLILTGLIVVAVFADVIAPYDPTLPVQGAKYFAPPFWMEGGSLHTPLGTDFQARDVLSRLIFGARVSLLVGLMGTLVAGTIGTAMGILSGYVGGWVDQVVMRFTDAWLALPALVFAIFLAAMIGPSMWNIVVILGAVYWTRYARVIRGEVLTLREREFVKLTVFPGVCILLIVLATQLFGDWLRVRLDPQTRNL